jgi:hypothetical protein
MKGPGTIAQQIESLKKKLTDDDVKLAISIRERYHPDVIALAYKLTRVDKKKELPKAVTDLIDQLPTEEAETIRTRLSEVRG